MSIYVCYRSAEALEHPLGANGATAIVKGLTGRP